MRKQMWVFLIFSSIQIGKCTDIQLERLQKMIEKLRDEIAKTKIGGRTDEKSSQDQEKRIGELEKKFTMDDDLFAEMNTNKSEDAQNFGVDHAFVKGIDSTKHALIEQVMHFSRPKRTITSENKLDVAFFAYIIGNHTTSPDHTLVFDGLRTNLGNDYNRTSGIFTAPQTRTYIFAWTIYCEAEGRINIQVVWNTIVLAGSHCNGRGSLWIRSVSETAVAQINRGDVVFIRTHPLSINNGGIDSNFFHGSTFAGSSLF